jgi:hypothetical protein
MKRGDMIRSISAATVALSLSVTGCSSSAPPTTPPAGALPPGTIDVAINGHSAERQHGLSCQQITSFTIANAGQDDSSVRAVVNDASGLSAVSVQLTDISGFTGSYNANLQGKADAQLVGTSTFVITGTADGFNADRPADRSKGDFTLRFAC